MKRAKNEKSGYQEYTNKQMKVSQPNQCTSATYNIIYLSKEYHCKKKCHLGRIVLYFFFYIVLGLKQENYFSPFSVFAFNIHVLVASQNSMLYHELTIILHKNRIQLGFHLHDWVRLSLRIYFEPYKYLLSEDRLNCGNYKGCTL